MPRHAHKCRAAEPGHIQRQHTRRLGGVNDQGDPPSFTQGVHPLHRQHKAEHIGNMGKDHTAGIRAQAVHDGGIGRVLVKQRRPGHGVGDAPAGQRLQRPGHRIVLIAGDHGVAAPMQQGLHGDI